MLAGAAFAQDAAGPLAFEVATVKPSEPITAASIRSGKMPHLGQRVSGSRVEIGNVTIADLIRIAYRVQPYQVTAPDWMSKDRFDIVAKMPNGTPKDQVPEMLQALLADRFKLTLHRETKEHPVYALAPGKNGLNLKEVSPDTVPPPRAADGPPPGVDAKAMGDKTKVMLTALATRLSGGDAGPIHMQRNLTMPALADMLSRYLDKPVVDMTGATGTYQVALDISADDLLHATNTNIVLSGMPAAVGKMATDTASDPGGGAAIVKSLQRMGLKLDTRKLPIEQLIVDRAERVPAEN
jgi:uncharacterized protein (TIGR03435 family)